MQLVNDNSGDIFLTWRIYTGLQTFTYEYRHAGDFNVCQYR